ncbi:MAG: diaminopimelate decarboxylase, partial [Ligilactobacillus agilis]|nr:diaminopimelate decarboxylase [Ligilactobacillus agilis]
MTEALEVNQAGHLTIGGVDALKLAEEYGTPVIAYDVSKIKQQIADFKKAFIEAGV